MGIFGHNSRVSKSKWLHVLIFWFFLHESEIYSIDSSKVIGYFHELWTSISYFSTSSSVTNSRFVPFIELSTNISYHILPVLQRVKDPTAPPPPRS